MGLWLDYVALFVVLDDIGVLFYALGFLLEDLGDVTLDEWWLDVLGEILVWLDEGLLSGSCLYVCLNWSLNILL
jgi:hypothetical protein